MHSHSIEAWRHDHAFLGDRHRRNEKRTWLVVALTAAMMVAEIVAGAAFGSMALLADGFHMATHAGALLIAALAYLYARRHAHDPRFGFGTGKLGDLAGFTSAIALALVAAMIAFESAMRLVSPQAISFDQAIAVAAIGLMVNLASAWLLHDDGHGHHGGHGSGDDAHHHGHAHPHGHSPAAHAAHHGQGHRNAPAKAPAASDHNLHAAYYHVLADALTSVLAIAGLAAGRFFGWIWMDALMGILGAIVIGRWSWGLLRESGAVLLDIVPDAELRERIRSRLETDGDRVADLHLWRVGPGHMAVIVSMVSDHPRAPADYKARLADVSGLSHITVEVQPCRPGRVAA